MDVRTQCLGLLMRGPASGYELKKRVEEVPFCHFLEASFAAIYPALTRLTKEGLVTATSQAQANRPDKKIYRLTPKGREAFRAVLAGPLDDDSFRSPWFVAMYFADELSVERVRALIAARIAGCEDVLTKFNPVAADTRGAQFAAGLGMHLLRAELDYLKTRGDAFAASPNTSLNRKHTATPTGPLAETLEL